MNVFGNMKIEKKTYSDLLYNDILKNQQKDTLQQSQGVGVNENLIADIDIPFNDVKIKINGRDVGRNDYYKDFEVNSPYNKISPNRTRQSYHTNEPIEQVDPSTFFGSSMNGIINKLRTNG